VDFRSINRFPLVEAPTNDSLRWFGSVPASSRCVLASFIEELGNGDFFGLAVKKIGELPTASTGTPIWAWNKLLVSALRR
jgi:hypothetical protein